MDSKLHPAITVSNIKNAVPIVLDNETGQYTSWSELFKIHCRAYQVYDHLLPKPTPAATSSPAKPDEVAAALAAADLWDRLDAIVLQWIYGTISLDLLNTILKPNTTAREAWTTLETLFQDNKSSRAIYLNQKLNNTRLDNFDSMAAYCQEVKVICDQLANVEAPLTDEKMVQQLVIGLNEQYEGIAMLISNLQPLSSFHEARSKLMREYDRKTNMTLHASQTAGAALHATTSQKLETQNQRSDQRSTADSHADRGRGRGRSRGRGRGRYGSRGPPSRNPQQPSNPFSSVQGQWVFQPSWGQGSQANQWSAQPPCPYPTTPRSAANQNPGILGPRSNQAYAARTDIEQALYTMSLNPPDTPWAMDSGATTHMTNQPGNFTSYFNTGNHRNIIVGNGTTVPVVGQGNQTLPPPFPPLKLTNVLYAPNLIHNLLSVRRLITDNWVSVTFDPFGFSVKDLKTRIPILRCNSTGDLYLLTPQMLSKTKSPSANVAITQTLWHQRLGHPGSCPLQSLKKSSFITFSKSNKRVCEPCVFGKSVKLPFINSCNRTYLPFEIVHSDLWTSPILSSGGHRYYVLFIDDFSDFLWTFPISRKSQVFSVFQHFYNLINTQFNKRIKQLQCDNGKEYINNPFHQFFNLHGMTFRLSCPHTSSQNGKAERKIRTINNMVRTLLAQSNLPNTYWHYALETATYLLNILPNKPNNLNNPTNVLYNRQPSYTHLRVFGCLCYPLKPSTAIHKLEHRSNACVFLGYPPNHRGYRCLDLKTRQVIMSRHVIFDEAVFPYGKTPNTTLDPYTFLSEPPHPTLWSNIDNTPHTPPSQTLPPADSADPPTPPITPTHGPTSSPHSNNLPSAHHHPPRTPVHNPNDQGPHVTNPQSVTPSPPILTYSRHSKPHKFRSDGSLERYKARLVCDGRSQQVGIDCGETFSPVVKPATIRTVLSIALSQSWAMHQLDVTNAFLHGNLNETVYMHQPMGFRDNRFPDHVCLLKKSLYGLKQAPRAWYQRFTEFVLKLGFNQSRSDNSLFTYHHGSDTAYLLLYVDDILLTTSSEKLRLNLMDHLSSEFAMKDLGPLSYFLGISVKRTGNTMFLSQQNYAQDIINRAGMTSCKPVVTPVDTKGKLPATGPEFEDPSLYRSLAGALQYLTFTRPDISYAVQQVCMHMHSPRLPHWDSLKRIIRYLRGTSHLGLTLGPLTSTSLRAYTDADWAGCPDTRRSTSGYCVYFGNNLLAWSSKRQSTISRSSAEAEYRGIANVVAEICWIQNLLLELHRPLTHASLVYCDNLSSIYLSGNPVQHQRTKHIELDIHFVREQVQRGLVRVLHVPSRYQIADIFTKGLPKVLFEDFRTSLSLREPPASTAGV
ncbi:hypothetical protein L1987_14684 [Smallanthus sonchifolius]|uniref:Uncharacterized protein n=1 Tax=Smallanthus sonchifolius TaxID=185202 RepID=A0ACB9J3W1_9ASTR|nr:hypothetical protein L1987_14684 [Smallanthus sonchifolius]